MSGVDQVFNELSLASGFNNTQEADNALWLLKLASDMLAKLGFSSTIRVCEAFSERKITQTHKLREYLVQKTGGREKTLRQWILVRFSKAPYVEQLCSENGLTELEEYYLDEERCKGLALAHLLHIPALSVQGLETPDKPFVTISHNRINEEGQLVASACQVPVVGEQADVQFHYAQIIDSLYQPRESGSKLLKYVERCLPFIKFSETAREQLQSLLSGNPILPRLCIILEKLNDFMKEAIDQARDFKPSGFNYTGNEGQIALTGKNGKAHVFFFKNLGDILCAAHMRITEGSRIYFNGDKATETVYVGYIGAHLPGKNFG